MLGGQPGQGGSVLDGSQFQRERFEILPGLPDVLLQLAQRLGSVLVGFLLAGGGRLTLGLQGGQLVALRRERLAPLVVVHQLAHQAIQSGQFRHGIGVIGSLVAKMLVTVENHPELGAPVTQMVVAHHAMPDEPKRAAQAVADHGRADVPDVHRLGHVRGGIVDQVGSRRGDRRNAQPRIGHRNSQPPGKPVVAEAEIDEARPGHLGRQTEGRHVQPRDDLLREFARRTAQPLAQRHDEISLVIAEPWVLALADPLQGLVQQGGVVDQTRQRLAETILDFKQDAHGIMRTSVPVNGYFIRPGRKDEFANRRVWPGPKALPGRSSCGFRRRTGGSRCRRSRGESSGFLRSLRCPSAGP